jgi:cellulose synthase/poly-beta-1,6-N-acetylglucosamine synthase-like glycosyltransferase
MGRLILERHRHFLRPVRFQLRILLLEIEAMGSLTWETIMLVVTLAALGYTWLGYPAMLWTLRQVFGMPPRREAGEPAVSIIVAAYNEETHIAAKMEDCLALDYPADKVEILVASDGSVDRTEEIVEEFARRDSRIRLIKSAGRAGKSGVQNLAVAEARGEILLFTDMETMTRSTLLRRIGEDFADPRVGMVVPKVQFGRIDDAVSKGQGAYWRFELVLRQWESDLGILATASGAAFALRRTLFRPIPPQYGDDCIVPLDVRLQGFRVLQDERLVVFDEMPNTIDGELRARVRMTARNWTGILSRPGLLNFLRYPGTALGLVSHKFLRWMTPLFLGAAFVINCLLAAHGRMALLFILQSCFYVAAVVGWRQSRQRPCARIFGYPFAFCLANLGFFLGLVRCLRGRSVVAYK